MKLKADSWRPLRSYFCVGAGWEAGAAGACAGAAGCDVVCFTPDRTERDVVPLRRTATIESVMDVTMKSTADHVVALESAVAAPRGPKAVWLPMPPKAAAIFRLIQ